MLKSKDFYVLSQEADTDIDTIFEYTVKEFGFKQAVKYVSDFDPIFKHLLINPNIGKSRDEIKKGLLSFIKEEHVIFYTILSNRIRIIRILHGRCDLPNQFSDCQ